ncbi:MAG: type II toxin-antitoxin system VapC family toxin [Sphingobacteriaceae bacterium]|nr:MAG: type II toxin-antitoxin system VapC family toxin [Sphingobacteriaceae bacterium]
MRILIDTHILIWYFDGNDKLPDRYKYQLDKTENSIIVSIASIWEIAIKINLGKLEVTKSLTEIQSYLIKRNFEFLEVKFTHLNILSILPLHHKDPFDRLLIAQSISENFTLISLDQHFQAYPINLLQ